MRVNPSTFWLNLSQRRLAFLPENLELTTIGSVSKWLTHKVGRYLRLSHATCHCHQTLRHLGRQPAGEESPLHGDRCHVSFRPTQLQTICGSLGNSCLLSRLQCPPVPTWAWPPCKHQAVLGSSCAPDTR